MNVGIDRDVKAKVLIVDDEPANLVLLEALLEDIDVDCVKAFDGYQAVEAVEKEEFALVILDVQMPGIDGFETIRLIHDKKKTEYLPIIIVSAVYSVADYQEYAIKCGAVDFLSKPFNNSILLGKVKAFVELYVQKKQVELYRNHLEEIVEERNHELRQANAELRARIEFAHGQEQELKIAKERAEDADKLKTAFLNNLSHEIRTPLNAIVCFSEMMTMPDLDSKSAVEFASYIKKSNRYLLNLVDNIISISKLESGNMQLDFKPIELLELIQYVVDYNNELLMSDDSKKNNVKLLYINKIVQNRINIYSDESFLRQIISLLIENAIKFTDKGSVTLISSIEELDNSSKVLDIEVCDTGIGISEEDQSIIFEKFRKAANLGNKVYDGAGIGLAIIKKQINLLHGTISLSSKLGVGSKFIVRLPLKLC